ncbi:MAG TPA: stage II sporulation protein M, partial [Ignavibacteriales bacterium]|nr:stage II sporulation protein M [Ignavibacteriales bacterium]
KGDPMGVYKSHDGTFSFLYITQNNIRVAFLAFILGIFVSFGTAMILFSNSIMLGSFLYFFYKYDALYMAMKTIWIHGTLEISAIIIAGAAGFVIGNSILFPGTYSRRRSFIRGARTGLKIVMCLVPVFIVAGFLESYVTRNTEMPAVVNFSIIFGSLAFVLWYFVFYPAKLYKRSVKAGFVPVDDE